MRTFDTPTPITAVLNLPAGRVQLIAADRTDTTVEVRPGNASKSRDTKAAAQTTIEFADGVLRVDLAVKNQYFSPSGAVEVTIQLPTGSKVETTADVTEFRAVGRLGDVSVNGAYSGAKIDEADTVRLAAYSGDVTVGRLRGDADISTQKGDLQITEAANGTVTLRTMAGDISVGAARGVSATLDAGTRYGRISNSLKNDGAADLTIHASTDYGDITAQSR